MGLFGATVCVYLYVKTRHNNKILGLRMQDVEIGAMGSVLKLNHLTWNLKLMKA